MSLDHTVSLGRKRKASLLHVLCNLETTVEVYENILKLNYIRSNDSTHSENITYCSWLRGQLISNVQDVLYLRQKDYCINVCSSRTYQMHRT